MTTELDWEALYRDRIHPAIAAHAGGVAEPRCIFIGGQQGSGKTSLRTRLIDELGRDCTQSMASDDLSALLPELYADQEDPEIEPLLSAFRGGIRQNYIDRLADHAFGLRANIVWELPTPGLIEGYALVARSLGYRVECLVLALPAVESWLSTLKRSLTDWSAGILTSPAVRWHSLSEAYLRWPTVIARAEAQMTFDRIAILDRSGALCFENEVKVQGDSRTWASDAFGFESLIVERARARTPEAVRTLISEWEALRSHPELAFRNRVAWPWEAFAAFDRLLRGLAEDPATAFDLNDPGASPAAAAAGWIARLRQDLDAILAGPGAADQPDLASRADRLMRLVSRIAGQPMR